MDWVTWVTIALLIVVIPLAAVMLFVGGMHAAVFGGIYLARLVRFLWRKRLYITAGVTVFIVITYIAGEVLYFRMNRGELPDVNELIRYNPPQIGLIKDSNGQVMIELATTFRKPVEFEALPASVWQAAVSHEDKGFFDHDGIPGPSGTPIAFRLGLFWRWFEGQGGSTITMQLARNQYLRDWLEEERRDKLLVDTWYTRWLARQKSAAWVNLRIRKFREMKYALYIERQLTAQLGSKEKSKELILSRYMSTVYYGYSMYGVDSAVRFYFNKPLDRVTPDEAALLASFIPAPSRYASITPSIEMRAGQKARRDTILEEMGSQEFLYSDYDCMSARGPFVTLRPFGFHWPPLRDSIRKVFATQPVRGDCRDEVTAYSAKTISFIGRIPGARTEAPAAVKSALNEVGNRGFSSDTFFSGSIRIHTTIDMRIQRIVNRAAVFAIKNYREVFPDETEDPQIAVVVLRNKDGAVLAKHGGTASDGYKRNVWPDFDRSTESWRQPGSAFKPFVYLAAFRAMPELTPDSIVVDDFYTVKMGGGRLKEIHNYDGKHLGSIPLWKALAMSRNIPAMKVGMQMAGLDGIVDTARMVGIATPIKHEPSSILGATDVTTMELTNGFRTIASNGIVATPYVINHITDSFDTPIWRYESHVQRLDVPQDALDNTIKLLRGAVRLPEGTAHSLDTTAFGVPVIAKTGTTNGPTDVRFECATYGPDGITVGVWIGFDDRRLLAKRAAGGWIALPVGRMIIKELYDSKTGILGRPPEVPAFIEDSIDQYLGKVEPLTMVK